MATTQDIQNWLAANPTASDADIAAAMNSAGVTTQQMADATGGALTDIQSRYDAASAPTTSGTSYTPSGTLTQDQFNNWLSTQENGAFRPDGQFDPTLSPSMTNGVYDPSNTLRNEQVLGTLAANNVPIDQASQWLGIPADQISQWTQANMSPTELNNWAGWSQVTGGTGANPNPPYDPTSYQMPTGYTQNPDGSATVNFNGGGSQTVSGADAMSQLQGLYGAAGTYTGGAPNTTQYNFNLGGLGYFPSGTQSNSPTAGTTTSTGTAPSYPTVSTADIQKWLAANPNASDHDIALAMQQYGVTPQQMADASGLGLSTVQQRYNAALGSGTSSGGSPTSTGGPTSGSGNFAFPGGSLIGGQTGGGQSSGSQLGGGGNNFFGSMGGLLGSSSSAFSSGPAPVFNSTVGPAPSYTSSLGAAPTLQAVNTSNPYLDAQAGAISNQFNRNLTQNILPAIGSQAQMVGGVGGSRQGIAQGVAVGQSNQDLSNSLSNLYGTDYENQSNRNLQQYQSDQAAYNAQRSADLQKYGLDLNQYNTGRGLDLQRYGIDSGNYNTQRSQDLSLYGINTQAALGLNGQNQNFYTAQRGQDLASAELGANLYGAGQSGYLSQGSGVAGLGTTQQQAPWNTLTNASNLYNQYSGFGGANATTSSGGGATGALGGAIAGTQLYNNLGFGSPTYQSGGGYGSVTGGYNYGGSTYNNPSAYTAS